MVWQPISERVKKILKELWKTIQLCNLCTYLCLFSLLFGPSLIINLAQLVSLSVALAAELVLDIYPGNICLGQIVTTPIQPQLKSKVGCDTKMTLIHHHHTNSMSSISQLLLTRFQPNFRFRFLGWTTTTAKITITTTTTTLTTTTLSTSHLSMT